MSQQPKGAKGAIYPAKADNLSNVYFAGQRMMPPGGLPVAVLTGRTAVQYLCRDEDLVFCGRAL
jgi:hypothetical protein